MTEVVVRPGEWTNVHFDSDRIAAVTARLADQIGLEGPIEVEVDETMPTGRVTIRSTDPVHLHAESGAFEDSKRPRQLSEAAVADVLGRLLFRVADRRSPGFADAPADEELTLRQSAAWDTYAVGRFAGLGYPANRQRRLYHFRTRHGFSDVSDAAFDRLWSASGLTWDDIEAVCRQTEGQVASGG